MSSFNRVILMGNLCRDVELRYIQSGTAVTEVTLAVHDRKKNANGEWVEDTTFVDVTLWGRTAEIASEYLGKGSPLFVEGRLKLDTWETDGQKRSKLRVVGERIQLIGPRGSRNGTGSSGTASSGYGSGSGSHSSGSHNSGSSDDRPDSRDFDEQNEPHGAAAAQDDIPF